MSSSSPEQTLFPLKDGKKWSKLEDNPVVFFAAEYALPVKGTVYAGGLGVLAADFLMQAADDGLPFVAFGPKYGTTDPEEFEVVKDPKKSGPLLVEVPIKSRSIKVKAWAKRYGESAVLFLLDPNVPDNHPEDAALFEHIYDLRFYVRLSQQILFGLAAARFIHALGIHPSIYHLNEGYTAFAALGAIGEKAKSDSVSFEKARDILREKIVASKHTIFSEAGLYIRSGELFEFIDSYCKETGIDPKAVFSTGMFELDHDTFSTTKFAIAASYKQNGVSILHTVFEKEVHPHSLLIPITNGVYKKRWKSPRWPSDVHPSDMDEETLWRTKCALREELVSFVKKASGVALDPKVCTIVWARRFAAYKRPELLFSDITRLKRLVSKEGQRVQFVVSGKAHESDEVGRRMVEHIKRISMDDTFKGTIAYVPDYSIDMSHILVQGADVWLNTPIRGKEACGTSGMKAGLNGTLELSISDGWVDEVDWEGKGWILPEEGTAEFIYAVLEGEIVPEFYDRDKRGIPKAWTHRMRATMDVVESRYGAERMLRDYTEKLYGLDKR